jgi:transposase-like protein
MKKEQNNHVTKVENLSKNSAEGEKTIRTFSSELKVKLVKDIMEKRSTVKQISDYYGVSQAAIYKWLDKFSPEYTKSVQIVVQMESEAEKTKVLMQRVAELERALGRKTLEVMYLEKIMELAKDAGIDVKKNFEQKGLSGSEEKNSKVSGK